MVRKIKVVNIAPLEETPRDDEDEQEQEQTIEPTEATIEETPPETTTPEVEVEEPPPEPIIKKPPVKRAKAKAKPQPKEEEEEEEEQPIQPEVEIEEPPPEQTIKKTPAKKRAKPKAKPQPTLENGGILPSEVQSQYKGQMDIEETPEQFWRRTMKELKDKKKSQYQSLCSNAF